MGGVLFEVFGWDEGVGGVYDGGIGLGEVRDVVGLGWGLVDDRLGRRLIVDLAGVVHWITLDKAGLHLRLKRPTLVIHLYRLPLFLVCRAIRLSASQ